MSRTSAISPEQFASVGDLLKYLRRRAGLTQRELSIAVGYSESQISRLEQNQRVPDTATLTALFLPAFHIENEPDWAARLLLLAAEARREEISTSDRSESSATPNNLPLQLTSFVGREPEIAEVKRLLSSHLAGKRVGKRDQVRLVTLIGPGGAGKTRLALQVAAGVLAAFPDGVRLVELAPLTDPALVPQTVATVLGMREEGGRPLLAMLIDHLRTKNLLLILDNCEHVVAACAQLADMSLRACPALHILATSREALGIAGEAAIPVPSLSLPALRPSLVPETLIQSEAGQLFVDRAARALPGFVVTHQNALTVAQVCHRLDGLPLAIELAAVRVKMLTVEQIVERLEDRFHLLTGGSRTALPRHQALAALIDWSYDLLSEAERALLRRLSVFAGGSTLEAAERVTSDEAPSDEALITPHLPLVTSDVLDLLTQLVNKSLVVVEREAGR